MLVLLALSAAAQDQLLSDAARLDGEHKCAEAGQLYQQALAKGAPSPALLNNVGNHYLACGSPDEARTYFEQLLKTNPAHVNANLQLARLAVERKEGAKALGYLSRIKAEDPEILLVKVEALGQTNQHAFAITAANTVARTAAGNPPVLFALGMACGRVGLYQQAEAAFNTVANVYPGDYDVLYNLGLAASRAEHYTRAQSAFEVALKIREDDPDALIELGRVESNLGDYNRSIYLLARARTLAPNRPDAALALARAAQAAGFFGDSALAYDDYLRLQPDDDMVRRDRAFVLGYSDATRSQALSELRAYLQRHPTDPVGYLDLAQISYHENLESALDQAAKAVALDHSSEPAHYVKAWLLHRLGHDEEALPELQTAVRLNSHDALAYDLLGLVSINLDKPAESEKALRQAAALSPTDPKILLHLARALGDNGKSAEAQQMLAQFRKAQPNGPPAPREEAGLIESATLTPSERSRRTIERLRQLIDKNPQAPSVRLDLGLALLLDGQTDQAVPTFRDLLVMNPPADLSYKAGSALLAYDQYDLSTEFLNRAVTELPAARLDLATAVLLSEGPAKALETLEQVRAENRTGDYFLLKSQIEDAAGHTAEADKLIAASYSVPISQPRLAQSSALLLLRRHEPAKALALLDRALRSKPDDPDLLLTRSVVLNETNRSSEAYRSLRQLEGRWPEWDSPYIVEGLLLERQSRNAEARQRIQIALALGAKDPAAKCALARATGAPDNQCSCENGIYGAFFSDCGKP